MKTIVTAFISSFRNNRNIAKVIQHSAHHAVKNSRIITYSLQATYSRDCEQFPLPYTVICEAFISPSPRRRLRRPAAGLVEDRFSMSRAAERGIVVKGAPSVASPTYAHLSLLSRIVCKGVNMPVKIIRRNHRGTRL